MEINDHGQVIGIVYQYERDGQNLNFGIHSSEAARLLQESVTYRDVAPARTYLSESAGQLDQALITAISNRLSSPLSPQLRWTKTTLGKESIFVLVPALIQNCERMDESDATLASVCQSVGGEWSVTIQRRARSLSKRLALFNGSRLVEPKPLAVIERLETEGRAPASNLDWFQSVPSRANCSALSRHRGFLGAAHSLEKAARGGKLIPATIQPDTITTLRSTLASLPATRPNDEEKREYPWGNESEQEEIRPGVSLFRANNETSGIGRASALGSFPAGASPVGCLDLSGNVWEWTRSLWGKDIQKDAYSYPYVSTEREDLKAGRDIYRIIRGGSYYRDRIGCSARYWDSPRNRLYFLENFGFRVVVSPPLSLNADPSVSMIP